MKIYNLTLGQNKMVSAIINDLTKPYKAHANTKQYELWCNEGICKVRQRALEKGLLLNDTDCKLSLVDLRAIIKGGKMKLINEKTGEVCEFMIHKFVGKSEEGWDQFAPIKDSKNFEGWKPYHEIEEFKDDDDSTLFNIDWERKAVRTNCGDFYYDYDISFADIKRPYETIKSHLEAK